MSRESPITDEANWFRGEDRTFRHTIYSTDTGTTPQPITGFAFSWVLRASKTGPILFTKTVGAGITITDGPNGQLEVKVDDVDSEPLSAGLYHYTLWRTDDTTEQVASFGSAVLKDRGLST